jgi:hypothetical protein
VSNYQSFRDAFHTIIPDPLEKLEIATASYPAGHKVLTGLVAGRYFALSIEGRFADVEHNPETQRIAGLDVGSQMLMALGRWKLPERPS